MTAAIDIGELPSWLLVLLTGLGVAWATSEGVLDPVYAPLGWLLVLGGTGLGAFYFALDIASEL